MRLSALSVVNYIKGGDNENARRGLGTFKQTFDDRDLYFADGSSFIETSELLLLGLLLLSRLLLVEVAKLLLLLSLRGLGHLLLLIEISELLLLLLRSRSGLSCLLLIEVPKLLLLRRWLLSSCCCCSWAMMEDFRFHCSS